MEVGFNRAMPMEREYMFIRDNTTLKIWKIDVTSHPKDFTEDEKNVILDRLGIDGEFDYWFTFSDCGISDIDDLLRSTEE